MAPLLSLIATALLVGIATLIDLVTGGAVHRILLDPIPGLWLDLTGVPVLAPLAKAALIVLVYLALTAVLRVTLALSQEAEGSERTGRIGRGLLEGDAAIRDDDGRWPLSLVTVLTIASVIAAPMVLIGAFDAAVWALTILTALTLLRVHRLRPVEPAATKPATPKPATSAPAGAVARIPAPASIPMTIVERLRRSPAYRGQLRAVMLPDRRDPSTPPPPIAFDTPRLRQARSLAGSLGIDGFSSLRRHQQAALRALLVPVPGA